MKKIIAYTLFYLIRFSLWFRYSVTIKGLDKLGPDVLNKPGGVLFLPNHPTIFVDPTLVTLAIWKKYPVRPVIVEYMFYTPIVHWIMKFMNAIPIPNFVTSSNSLKKKKVDQVFETMIKDLKNGDDFLIYPAGKVKHQAKEIIGASGVHRVIQSAPEANIVLVRTTGLWGSSFSRALTGSSPPLFETIYKGFLVTLKNLLFFTPRRKITIEFEPAGPNFPINGSRQEMNRFFEKWYNRPDGIVETQDPEPGESLYLVSYSMWGKDFPEIKSSKSKDSPIELKKIPEEIKQKVVAKLAEIAQVPPNEITPEKDLGSDLGLDSLDTAELLSFLDDAYDVSGVPVAELTTVASVMGIAAKQITFGEQVEEHINQLSKWYSTKEDKRRATMPNGDTIHEVFLNQCAIRGKEVACGDSRAGVITYEAAKLRVILLAEYIRHLPGEYIGILLPSSVAATLTILACQLAGKIPLMVNWTVGSRHLETVASLSHVQVVLSSWAFLDKLDNVDLTGIDDKIVTLEDARRSFGIKDKLTAYYRSKLSTESILKIFDVQDMTKKARAVLLFTSGTENLPKGVPLTHENILTNQRAALEDVEIYNDDVLLSILPPFHSFGFTVSGLLPLVAGIRVAYYPDPTDGLGIAKSVERWKATLICGAPSFLKGMFKNTRPHQLDTLRLCITGAEKAPKELFEMIKTLPNCRIMEGYGITECAPVLTINKEGNPAKGVGQPLPGVTLKVINIETHQVLEKGENGLIVAKGPNIFSGYLNKGIHSPFTFIDNEKWYITGDLGYIDPEGNLIISGRLKRFIKIGGEMMSLSAIEEALIHTIGKKAQESQVEGPILAICAKEEPGEKPKLFLFTTFATTYDEANKALKDGGFSNLVKIFKTQQLTEIPIMGTGKVNYRALEAQIPSLNDAGK